MAFEILIIAFILAGFVYLSGPAYSFWIPYIILFGFLGFIVALFTKKKEKKAVSGGGGRTVLEPIVIERKREAPPAMPEDMEIWFKADGKIKRGYEKVTGKGPVAYFGTKLGQLLGSTKKKKED